MAVTKDAWRSFPSWVESSCLEACAEKVHEGLHGFRMSLDLSVPSVRMERNAAYSVLKFPPKLSYFMNKKGEFMVGRVQDRRKPALHSHS